MPYRHRRNLNKRVNKLEREARPEVKHLGEQSSGFDTIGSNSGTLLLPQSLAQGTARNQRIGDKVKTRNIRFQAIFKMPSLAANPTCAIRVLVLRSKFTNPSTSDMPAAYYSTVDEDKFFVIKDLLTQVSVLGDETNAGTTVSTGSTLKKVKFNIPTGLRKLQYDGAGDMSPLNNEYCIHMFAENQSAEVAYNWQHYYIDN